MLIMICIGKWSPDIESLDELFCTGFLYMEQVLKSSIENQVNGIVVVADFKNYGLNHVRNTSPFRFRQMLSYIQVNFFTYFFHFVSRNACSLNHYSFCHRILIQS